MCQLPPLLGAPSNPTKIYYTTIHNWVQIFNCKRDTKKHLPKSSTPASSHGIQPNGMALFSCYHWDSAENIGTHKWQRHHEYWICATPSSTQLKASPPHFYLPFFFIYFNIRASLIVQILRFNLCEIWQKQTQFLLTIDHHRLSNSQLCQVPTVIITNACK